MHSVLGAMLAQKIFEVKETMLLIRIGVRDHSNFIYHIFKVLFCPTHLITVNLRYLHIKSYLAFMRPNHLVTLSLQILYMFFQRSLLQKVFHVNLAHCSPQCVHTQSHAYLMKIPMTYYDASTTNFRLF